MLWTTSTIKDYEIETSDGQIGTLTDMFCDDAKWKLRWIMADASEILASNKVLIPGEFITSIDRPLGKVHLKLSTSNVISSPLVEGGDVVLRQTEITMSRYYGSKPYWDGKPNGQKPEPVSGTDTNLRSLSIMRGFKVEASDGRIGSIADFLLNDSDWSIRYIVVDTGTWLPGQRVLIAPNSVSAITNEDNTMHLTVDREKVKSAPPYDPSITMDGAYDEKFLTYYGIRWLEG